ncbi:hypothetical protein [Xanthobacter pseudotagetidis]|uniref:hypothetical protein n=1 Tax=Xanthobacter pseudotagetidis TaxID=3119911 RepID=UPI00372A7B8F
MSKSVVIGVAAAIVLAASAGGGGMAVALQAASEPAPRTMAAQKASAPGTSAAPACGLRKIWVATASGPRLKWRRPCTEP